MSPNQKVRSSPVHSVILFVKNGEPRSLIWTVLSTNVSLDLMYVGLELCMRYIFTPAQHKLVDEKT